MGQPTDHRPQTDRQTNSTRCRVAPQLKINPFLGPKSFLKILAKHIVFAVNIENTVVNTHRFT